MRDPIFWAWHNHIDGILSAWQAVQTEGGAVGRTFGLYTFPSFDATWQTVRVAFQMRAIPEFIKPHHLNVNGSPGTSVTDVSFTGTGYVFDFTGFDVPADGLVEVVIRREVDTHVRTSNSQPRPAVGMIMSIYGQVFSPNVVRTYFTK